MNHFLSGFTDELVKIAVDRESGKGNGLGLLEAGMVASTIAPFMGLIGEEKILHDPHVQKSIMRFTSLESLERHARPGDIVLMSGPRDPTRPVTTAISGTDWSHAQPVVGVRDGKAVTLSAGRFNRRDVKVKTRADFMKMAPTLAKDMKSWGYTDAVILRPKNKMSNTDLKKFVDEVVDRSRMPWDAKKAVSGVAKDLFIPKRMVSEGALKKIEGQTMIRYGNIVDPVSGKKVRVPMTCKGNTCSGLSAQAARIAGGGAILGSKLPADILPADFVRSKQYRPVGAVINKSKLPVKILPYLTRAGVGTAAAGGIYAAHERPELLAAGVGAAGGSALQGALTRRIGKAMGLSYGQTSRKIPNLMRSVQKTVSSPTTIGRVSPILKYLAMATPMRVLGGLAALKVGRVALGREGE